MAPKDQYLEWKRTRHDIGCVFARLMAVRPTEYGQRIETIVGNKAGQVANKIDAYVSAFLFDGSAATAAFVLPSVVSLGTLVEIALQLGPKPGWQVTRKMVKTPAGELVAFRVTRDIAIVSGGTVPSEVLALGPFPEFPATRKSPITALEIFVGTAPALDKDGQPSIKANLANVELPFPSQAAADSAWDQTKKARLKSLGNIEDNRAKAKVTFVISTQLAKSMGCEP